jgi:cyanocobalamin reductase (cyanide-eliminating) / alkylcobalamin dealkylase
MLAYPDIVKALRRSCSDAGFDLVQPLSVGWYNRCVEGALRLDDFGSASHLALVIGNTRALWPRLLEALRRDPELLGAAHPLEAYTERSLTLALSALGIRSSVRFAHDAGEQRVAMQRLAHVAGLAYLSESHLSVHATYGPWIGLRAAVSFSVPGPSSGPPTLQHPCGSCVSRCLPAFERALSAAEGPLTSGVMQSHWQLWLACRDTCPTGREHRYDDAQIRYHYLQDTAELRRLCADPGDVG